MSEAHEKWENGYHISWRLQGWRQLTSFGLPAKAVGISQAFKMGKGRQTYGKVDQRT